VNAIRTLIVDKKYEERKNNDDSKFLTFKFSDIANSGGAIYQYDNY
jgi:hypothetical protein